MKISFLSALFCSLFLLACSKADFASKSSPPGISGDTANHFGGTDETHIGIRDPDGFENDNPPNLEYPIGGRWPGDINPNPDPNPGPHPGLDGDGAFGCRFDEVHTEVLSGLRDQTYDGVKGNLSPPPANELDVFDVRGNLKVIHANHIIRIEEILGNANPIMAVLVDLIDWVSGNLMVNAKSILTVNDIFGNACLATHHVSSISSIKGNLYVYGGEDGAVSGPITEINGNTRLFNVFYVDRVLKTNGNITIVNRTDKPFASESISNLGHTSGGNLDIDGGPAGAEVGSIIQVNGNVTLTNTHAGRIDLVKGNLKLINSTAGSIGDVSGNISFE